MYLSDYEVETLGTVQGQYIVISEKKYKIQRADNGGYYVKEVSGYAKTDEK